MEITPNSNFEPVARKPVYPARRRPPQADTDTDTDTAAFPRAETLKQTVQATPLVREDKVARARQHIGDVRYPPEETIQRIAVLLAKNLEHNPNGAPNNEA